MRVRVRAEKGGKRTKRRVGGKFGTRGGIRVQIKRGGRRRGRGGGRVRIRVRVRIRIKNK